MTDEQLDKLWNVLSSAAGIKNLDYPEAVTIGGVFGEMKAKIKKQRESLEEIKRHVLSVSPDFEEDGSIIDDPFTRFIFEVANEALE